MAVVVSSRSTAAPRERASLRLIPSSLYLPWTGNLAQLRAHRLLALPRLPQRRHGIRLGLSEPLPRPLARRNPHIRLSHLCCRSGRGARHIWGGRRQSRPLLLALWGIATQRCVKYPSTQGCIVFIFNTYELWLKYRNERLRELRARLDAGSHISRGHLSHYRRTTVRNGDWQLTNCRYFSNFFPGYLISGDAENPNIRSQTKCTQYYKILERKTLLYSVK